MSAQFCPYCDREMNEDPKSVVRKTRDHVIPQCMGGKVVIWACWQCNNDKANRTPVEWHQILAHKNDERVQHVARFLAEQMATINDREGLVVVAETDARVKAITTPIALFMWGTNDETSLTRRQWGRATLVAREVIENLSNGGFLKEKTT